MYLGDFLAGAMVDFKWNTLAAGIGSITRATNGTIKVYKNNSTTERASASGITDSEDFDGRTGVHHCRIDLSDNADAGFYAAGNDYQVLITGAVVDGETINAAIGSFSIENRNAAVWAAATRTLTAIDEDSTTLDLDATIRAAIGMAAANLDTQLTAIDDAVDSEIAAIITALGTIDTVVDAIQAKTDNLPSDPADASVIAGLIAALEAKVDTIDNFLDTEVAAILADTNELQTDWVDGGRLDLLVDAIKAKTDALPSDPADASVVAGLIAAIEAKVDIIDANVDSVLVDTGTDIPASIDALPTAAELATALAAADDAMLAALAAVDAKIDTIDNFLDTEIAAILADTNELQTDWVDGGRLDLLLDAVKAKTDALPSDPADASVIAGLIAALEAKVDIVDSNVDSVLVDTGTDIPALIDALPTNAELATALGTADDAVLSALVTIASNIDALPTNAELATALGTADDAMLAAIAALSIPSAAANAAALLDLADGIETGMTVRQALRFATAVLGGDISGAGTGTELFRAAVSSSKVRVTSSPDEDGNRTVTSDLT